MAATANGRELYHNVSFEARPGTTTFVVGASDPVRVGILGALLGIEPPASGTVAIDGHQPTMGPATAAGSTVAIAPRDPQLVAGTIADNIVGDLTGVEIDDIWLAAETACVTEFTDTMTGGLDTEITERGRELTIGQRRLIALARAVLRRPAVLLIEEPTAELTPTDELLTIKAIGKVTAGTTTVLTTDRITLADAGDQIVRFDGSRPETTTSHATAASTMLLSDWESHHTPGDPGPAEALTEIDAGHQLAPGLSSTTLLERATNTETWLAWALERDHLVQVKVPRRAPATLAARQELACEFQRVTSLRHPGLARPIEADLIGESPYALYEHVDGPTLATILDSRVQLPDPRIVLRMGYELARTLSSLHDQGLAHLDLRPEIVVLSAQGTILTDLAKARPIGSEEPSAYRAGQIGTIAPEQLRGDPASPAMDVFALGVLMYQAATGTLSSGYHGTLRNRNHILAPRPPQRRSGFTPVRNRRTMTWSRSGGIGGTRTRRTTRTWSTAGDSSIAIESMVGRLTAADPEDRPTARQAMALMRPYLYPVSEEPTS
jgi:ABC-type branched-subunit amino acid transport system ATPase component